MSKLQGHIALITGGGRGIGRAVAIGLAKEGAAVGVSARSEEELNEVVSTIRAEGGTAHAFPSDLSQEDAPRKLVEEVKATLGAPDILVNNAGLGSSSNPKPTAELDDDFWEKTLRINLTVPFLLSKLVLPAMRAKGWGRIINVSSINGKVASFHGAAYAASKHGLLGLTRTLAIELATEGITVNAICPGPVRTVMNDKRIQYDADRLGVSFEEREKAMTPMGRRVEPEEIAPMAVYLASDEAAMVTGQAWNIDGGLVMY